MRKPMMRVSRARAEAEGRSRCSITFLLRLTPERAKRVSLHRNLTAPSAVATPGAEQLHQSGFTGGVIRGRFGDRPRRGLLTGTGRMQNFPRSVVALGSAALYFLISSTITAKGKTIKNLTAVAIHAADACMISSNDFDWSANQNLTTRRNSTSLFSKAYKIRVNRVVIFEPSMS